MIRHGLALALCLAAGCAAARPAMTSDDTTMRAAPSPRARIVQRIPAHAQIDVGECGETWCDASWRDLDGFVRVEAIGPNDAPLEVSRDPYGDVGGPVIVGPAFGFSFYRHW